ncbi:hypothetical protein QJQ45_025967 [Haematococcus lacustris]|nr:hypothetical protein QJQ45_025967 [Haematococcus lacustris]
MLDLLAVFTRGGALLWTLQFTALRHSPVEALNSLIRTCLLEERSGVNTFTFTPKAGAAQALKWSFHNGLGLVFVAVYQKALSLMYVDELLATAKLEFVTHHYKANVGISTVTSVSISMSIALWHLMHACPGLRAQAYSFPEFEVTFRHMLKDCEQRADAARKGTAVALKAAHAKQSNGKHIKGQSSGQKGGKGISTSGTDDSEEGAEDGDAAGKKAVSVQAATTGLVTKSTKGDTALGDVAGEEHRLVGDSASEDAVNGTAFNLSKLAKGGARGKAAPGLKAAGARGAAANEKKKESSKKVELGKKARNWDVMKGGRGSGPDLANLDFSVDSPADVTVDSGSDATGTYSESDGGLGAKAAGGARLGVSRMDVEDEDQEGGVAALLQGLDEEQDAQTKAGKSGSGAGSSKGRGLLGSFMSSLAMRVVGKQALSMEDLQPALADMKRKLMERNVAEAIAQNICDSVSRSLEGQKLASFTGVASFVARAFEDALSGILHKRTIDLLLDIKKAQERGRPYVVVFCGVNGVGKSTNLAKIAYWLGQHNVKVGRTGNSWHAMVWGKERTEGLEVLIAACDTFRAGAVEQLKTHCTRLKVPLYERGYEKDPAKVAAEAIKQAERDGQHVVLVDTAGRMQDNEPLMRALSSLINVNNPNLVLFVGEALVGNDAVDQLVKFNRALHDLAPHTATTRHAIDGIVLTKFDTIDDKVGAAVSMVYASGAPIMFLGCGQTYADLKRLNVKAVVNALLK